MAQLDALLSSHPTLDYIAVSGDGDPTLHVGLTALLKAIRQRTKVSLAVVSSGGLLWRQDVQRDLRLADVVLALLDASDMLTYHALNRPLDLVPFARYTTGLAQFQQHFRGKLWLLSHLVGGITAIEAEVVKMAVLVRNIDPEKVFVTSAAHPGLGETKGVVGEERLRVLARLLGDQSGVPVICENSTTWIG
jgi:wyosine [tRNA(Phe)-imidazoG37] synthetase (radical SAM superfamily)